VLLESPQAEVVKWIFSLLLRYYGFTEVKIASKMIAGCGLSVVPSLFLEYILFDVMKTRLLL